MIPLETIDYSDTLSLRFITFLTSSSSLSIVLSQSYRPHRRAFHSQMPYICILPYIILPYLPLCLWFISSPPCDPLYIQYIPHTALSRSLCLSSCFAKQVLGTYFSGRSTDSFLLPVSHLASCHTELVTRYVTSTALVRIKPYATGRAVASRLAPTFNTIDSQEGHLLSCVG